jgi:tetratricopeptide (TPR) repeat protein
LRLKLYERALSRDPRNHFLLLDLAREYGRHRRIAEADQMLRRLVEHYPASAQVRSQAATAYAAVGLTQRAIEHYRGSLRLDPAQPDAAEIRRELARLTSSSCVVAAG